MRARFSAFALADEAYLLRSWHPSTRPEHVEFDPDLRWTDLQILGTTDGGLFADEGTVEFMAHYDRAGQAGSLHELSPFVRSGQRWVYLDAVDADLS
jgi:SEC-C motif-containing protein